MIASSVIPIALGLAGPLADNIFIPLLSAGSTLAESGLGEFFGVGPGRGIGLMFTLSGLLIVVISVLAYANPRIRKLEQELPDALPDVDEPEQVAASSESLTAAPAASD